MLARFPKVAAPAAVAQLRRRLTAAFSGILAILAIALSMLLPAQSVSAQGTIPTAPEWLEPRGLSIVDMVGFVPEDQLRDAILVYETGTGLVQYVSGSRVGNTVTINVRMTPRYGPGFTVVGCLAQPAAYDQWPTIVPASTMQIFAGGKDVTSLIDAQSRLTPAGLVQPTEDASGYLRYPRTAGFSPGGASPARLPANGSCQFLIIGRHENLTARFVFNTPPRVNVTFVSDQLFFAHSYIGEGGAGALGPLVDQMTRSYGTRHDAFDLEVPDGADYVFVKYGSTAFDPYAGQSQYNYGLAGSGTYRFELSNGGLAVDMVNSMGIPARGNWRDSDQMGGSSYLSYSSLGGRIKSPEYFLPPGIPFQPCMASGGCPSTLLDQIYQATFPVQVYYYRVERLAGSTLVRVPLKMVGKGWKQAAAAQTELPGTPYWRGAAPLIVEAAQILPSQALPAKTFLPLISKPLPPVQPPPPDDPTGCPCGWFDAQGAMLDFIPPQ